ncbi:MAG: DUF2194 domain-containing protein [Eubacteriales bacterium]|nr:DUF2194 domain-containing protein [Eubacteriales bacterium]
MRGWKRFRYSGLLTVWLIFLAIAAILYAERSGIRYMEAKRQVALLEPERVVTSEEAMTGAKPVCLVLMNGKEPVSQAAWKQFAQILKDMKVGYRLVDIAGEPVPDFKKYETAVLLIPDISLLKEKVLELADWVKQGGDVLFGMIPQKEPYLELLEQKFGVISSGYSYAMVSGVYVDESFMLGGGRSYQITDPFESAWAVELEEDAKVYVWSDDEKQVPIIWKHDYGDGSFVMNNLGMYEKATRGFYAASYSLLTDVSVYPVINGSTFYLDDFPSPVPSGDGKYVKRDYGMGIAEFYTNVWWPDMVKLAQEHGVHYTGVIIENYEDDTKGAVEPQKDIQRFQYFGNLLLHQGGELGYHGYNHQPLCLSNVDYEGMFPYHTWESSAAVRKAVGELVRFGEEMFPTASMEVYVPPSNILSEEGRRILARDFPQIRTVASNYFSGEFAYVQEFEVADDGMVEQPRIISGCILDDYMQMAAFSELNMHFVNNHFMHPDDLLDEDRGAKLGWEKLKHRLDEYMDWLYTSAPAIRNLCGTELSGAIQRYGALTVTRQQKETEVLLALDHFYDEAYLFVRFNEGAPGEVTGGELTRLTGDLYLLHATSESVTISKSR